MREVKIKICGLSREEDIAYVNEARPDYCGFVIHVPKSIRSIAPDRVRALRRHLLPGILPVGVFVNEPVKNVAALLADHTIEAVQLHGEEDEAYIRALRSCGPVQIIQAFRVPSGISGRREEALARWREKVEESTADLVLLDQGGGGTGQVFDWSLAEKIRRPFFLAGGIGADNVRAALDALHPWGVDMSSSVETDGKKDRDKILSVVSTVRRWSQDPQSEGKPGRKEKKR